MLFGDFKKSRIELIITSFVYFCESPIKLLIIVQPIPEHWKTLAMNIVF